MGKSFGGRDSFSDQLFSGSRASASAAKYKRPASAHGSRGKPAASKPVSVGLADAGGSPAEENGGVRREHVAKLESEMREVLKAHRTVYQGEKELLQKIFRRVDDGNQAVDLDEFLELWDRLGVQMTEAEGIAVFKKHGCSERRPMAYDKFVEAFTARPSRKLGQEMIRKGAFVAGQKANFSGKILYPQCRKGVFAPTDWDPSLARRSAELPEASLELEFVYGYNGLHNTAPNLFYTGTGEVVYYTAAIGIVYDKETNTQRFFLGHSDDIKSLGLCRAEVALPDGSLYPPRTLVASGQVRTPISPIGRLVASGQKWGFRALSDAPNVHPVEGGAGNKPLQTLPFDPSARGILAVAFSPDGRTLVTVSSDNQHTVCVWDWISGALLCEGKGAPGEPPQASYSPLAALKEAVGGYSSSGPEVRGRDRTGADGCVHQWDVADGNLTVDRLQKTIQLPVPFKVYGALWDPFSSPMRFVTYGVKHLKLWTEGADMSSYQSSSCTFSKCPMQNVVSAEFLKPPAAGSEGLLATGMPSGEIYLWKLGESGGKAVRTIMAHKSGPSVVLPDGQQTFHGLRCLKLRADHRTLLSA
eukprot:gene5597-6783_t